MYFALTDDDINNKYHFYKQGLNKVLHKKEINEKINDVNKMALDRCIYFVHGVDEICESYDGCSNFIRILIIPHNANISNDVNRFDKVILSEKYPLFDIKTIKKFNLIIDREYIIQVCLNKSLDILKYLYYNDREFINIVKKNSDIFDSIAMEDNVEILEWWKTIGLPININNYIASIASCYGNVNVLEWWFNSGLPLKYDNSALSIASMHGHVNVLNWWVNSGLPLQYDESCIDRASKLGYVNVLQWWLDSGLQLKYTHDSMDNVCDINVLDWWLNSKLPLKYNTRCMITKSCDVLDWWLKSNLPLKYDERALEHASFSGKIKVLNWWLKSNLLLKYDEKSIDGASSRGYVDVLEWWKDSGLPLKYTEKAIDDASQYGYVNVLEWWFKSNLELKYTTKSLYDVVMCKSAPYDILVWWENSGLELKYNIIDITSYLENDGYNVANLENIVKWWKTKI
jgi:hypothetical protein